MYRALRNLEESRSSQLKRDDSRNAKNSIEYAIRAFRGLLRRINRDKSPLRAEAARARVALPRQFRIPRRAGVCRVVLSVFSVSRVRPRNITGLLPLAPPRRATPRQLSADRSPSCCSFHQSLVIVARLQPDLLRDRERGFVFRGTFAILAGVSRLIFRLRDVAIMSDKSRVSQASSNETPGR